MMQLNPELIGSRLSNSGVLVLCLYVLVRDFVMPFRERVLNNETDRKGQSELLVIREKIRQFEGDCRSVKSEIAESSALSTKFRDEIFARMEDFSGRLMVLENQVGDLRKGAR